MFRLRFRLPVWFCHMVWFLTAASRSEKALNAFNVQLKPVSSLGSLMYANDAAALVWDR